MRQLPLRSRPAIWLLAPAMVLVLAYYATYVRTADFDGYWVAVASNSGIFLLFSCAYAALTAALEGNRERTGPAVPGTRSGFRIVVGRTAPSVLGAIGIQCVGFLLVANGTWGAPGSVPLVVPISFVGAIVFHTALGFVFGRTLPTLLAIPLSLVISYSWLGFTWSTSYFPLRYLAGLEIVNCCSVTTTLDLAGPLVTAVFSFLVAGALVFVGSVPRWAKIRPARVALACVAITATGAGCLFAARDFGAGPETARSQSEAQCIGAEPSVCFFPEQQPASEYASVLARASANLDAAGIPVPAVIRFGSAEQTDDAMFIAGRPKMSEEDLMRSYSGSFVPASGPPFCDAGEDFEDRLAIFDVTENLIYSIATTGTVSPALPGNLSSEYETELWSGLSGMSSAQISAWYDDASAVLKSCSAVPSQASL